LTCSILVELSDTDCSERAATTTRAITSRYVSSRSKESLADTQDLSQLGREMEDCIIIDNSPASYIFHPHNAVPVSTWFNDPHDTELTDLCPFLTDLATVDDIRGVLDGNI
jgi:TFIIF-interacting CTD phosphatase-like protein